MAYVHAVRASLRVILLALACNGCGGCLDDPPPAPGNGPPAPTVSGFGPSLANRPRIQRQNPLTHLLTQDAGAVPTGDGG